MSIRDMSKEVYLSSNDERTFDEDSNYSLYSSYEAGLNIQSFATKLGDLKRPFSLPYKSIRNSVNFSRLLDEYHFNREYEQCELVHTSNMFL